MSTTRGLLLLLLSAATACAGCSGESVGRTTNSPSVPIADTSASTAVLRPPLTELDTLVWMVGDLYRVYPHMQDSVEADPRYVRAARQLEWRAAPWFTTALTRYAQRQADNPGEALELDFDPFTNAQDDCESYVLGGYTSPADTVAVPVFCVEQGKAKAEPQVVLAISQIHGHWRLADIRYPGQPSLLKILYDYYDHGE